MKNEWQSIATEAPAIQDAKNRVLNPKLFALLKEYAPHGGKLFDYGCGWGEFADQAVQNGFAVEAFDDAPDMVTEARARYKTPHFYTSDEFKKKLPKMERRFDVVTSNLVLCILSQDAQDEMLRNIKHVSKKSAPLILTFCNPCSDYLTLGVVTKRMRSHTWNPRYDKEFKYKKTVHENGISFTDYHRPLAYYTRLFKKHGLEILDLRESNTLGTEAHPDFMTFVLRKK